MPELPEVETQRRIVEGAILERVVVEVRVVEDRLVFQGVAPEVLRARIVGRRVVSTARRGKSFWLEFDVRPSLLFHLGMSGAMTTVAGSGATLAAPRLHANGQGKSPLRFEKITLFMDDGARVTFSDPRRFGRVRLLEDPTTDPVLTRLGFDPLVGLPPLASFSEFVARRRRSLKSLLLDQSFAAGVGNWIADEVLYHAKLSPHRGTDSLSEAEIRALRETLGTVVRTAVRVGADSSRFPKTWLFPHRWGRKADAATPEGEKILFETLAGRTTAWVPSRQR